MSQKIYVIFTDDTKPRRFIKATSRRTHIDNNLAVETTTEVRDAHDFGSIDNCIAIIPRLHNPCDRSWKYTTAPVAAKSVTETIKDDID